MSFVAEHNSNEPFFLTDGLSEGVRHLAESENHLSIHG